MKPIIHTLQTLLLIVCLGSAAFAQGNKKSRDIYQTRDFSISFTGIGPSISVSLYAKYIDSTDYYYICLSDNMDDVAKSFKLYEPLNYEYFRLKLTELLQSKIGDNCISTPSMLSVFYWIYTLKRDESEESLTIADLHLGKWAMVLGVEFPKYNPREREEKITVLTEQITELSELTKSYEFGLQQLLKNVQAKFKAQLDSLEQQHALAQAKLNKIKDSIASCNDKKGEMSDEYYGKLPAIRAKNDSIEEAQLWSRYSREVARLGKEIASLENKRKDSDAAITAYEAKTDLTVRRQGTFNRAAVQMRLFALDSTIARNMLTGIFPDTAPDEQGIRDSILFFYVNHIRKKPELENALRSLKLENICKIKKISLQFERGFLERIQVWVINKYGKEDIYENNHAIGISSTTNLNLFSEIRLYLRKYRASEYIYLSDALGNYDNMLDISTRDYSPADTVINEVDPFTIPIVTLRKERLVRLFDSRIYTDLVGLDESSPNGLVQVEVSRRFNLITYRNQVGPYLNIGLFNYCNISGGLTKIENKERYLPVRNSKTVINNTLVSPSYVTNLDLRRYENTYLSVDANTFLFDAPAVKTSLSIDFGVRYGHTSVTDSAWRVNTAGEVTVGDSTFRRHAHTITFELPKITLEFFSERRVGFLLRYQYNVTHLFSNNYFKQVMSDVKSDLTQLTTEKRARKSHMVEFMLRVETSRNDNGRVFLRARYFLQHGDANNFFPQIQLGYAYNLLFKKD